MKRSLLVPFIFILVVGFGTSWLLYIRGSHEAVLAVVDALVEDTVQRAGERVEAYLQGARNLAETDAAFIHAFPGASSRLGDIRKALRLQLLTRPEVDLASVGFADGEYAEAQRLADGSIRTGSAGKATGGNLVLERTDGRGTPVDVELIRTAYDPRERPWYQRARELGKAGWTDPYPILSTGDLAMAAVVPVFEDRSLLAVVTANIGLHSLSDFLSGIVEPSGGIALLVDELGLAIAGSMPHAEGAPRSPNLDSLDPRLAAIMRAGTETPGIRLRVDTPDGRYRAVLRPLGAELGLRWRLAIAYPEAAFLQPLEYIDSRVALILTLMLAASIILAFVTANHVAAPLKRLGEALSAFTPGGAADFVKAGAELALREDEIGRLARSSTALAERLDASFSELQTSLAEKEVLLKEVHHRVKNNLQIVSSLVRFQSGSSADPSVEEGLERLQERIQAMAFVHEDVYQSGDFEAVAMDRYLQRIAESLCGGRFGGGAIPASCPIEISVQAKDLSLGLDRAIPCGLVANELIANALKHAFRDRKEGRILISLRLAGAEYELDVADDGCGLPAASQGGGRGAGQAPRRPDGSEGIGASLVTGLVAQLRGRASFESDERGTRVRVFFPR